MPNVLIRNVPDALHTRLKKRAMKNNRSLNQEVIAELSAWTESMGTGEQALKRSRARTKQAGTQVEQLRKRMKYFMKASQIDQAVAEGRK